MSAGKEPVSAHHEDEPRVQAEKVSILDDALHSPSAVREGLEAASSVAPTSENDASLALVADTSLPRDDLWQRIRNGFAMRELDSPLIARHEQWYASRPDYVARMMERSRRYLYFITEEVEKRGMPAEIALLPMIESAFNPGANSVSNASGIWQFIPSTGRNFGMKQNWWYDGRRDIIGATTGALDYLQKLHDQFGDWELALAAYNCGEGAVERAIERNRARGKPVDYSHLRLSDETRNYVPKLLAVKNIVSNPEKYGLPLPPLPDAPYFTVVTTARHIDVELAARLAGISMDEFIALNPANNRPVILQENSEVLLLPVDRAEAFRENLKNCKEPLVSWQAYRLKKGERLDDVAPRFGLSLSRLKAVNGLPARARLRQGQSLLVPLNGEEGPDEFEPFDPHLVSDALPRGRVVTHVVRKGETLSSISRRYRVKLASLQDWNDGISHIQPGQRITVVQAVKRGKSRHMAKMAKKSGPRLSHSVSGKKPVARRQQVRRTQLVAR